MRKIMEYSGVFAAGGIIYVLIELLFRGYSHWTMFIVGGFAVVCLYLISATYVEEMDNGYSSYSGYRIRFGYNYKYNPRLEGVGLLHTPI